MEKNRLSDLVDTGSSDAVFHEAQIILNLISPSYNTTPVSFSFTTAVKLYEGNYNGYKACNTEYHNLRHATDTFLTMARMIHGAILQKENFEKRHIDLGLIAALFHDAGYIQKDSDNEGTGAKYTVNHVQRGMEFLEIAGSGLKLSDTEIVDIKAMLLCTDLAIDISTIPFSSDRIALLAKMLGASDLLAQMSDRIYLEKLLFLYQEFKEAGLTDYKSESDLLRKTIDFYDFCTVRLETALESADRFIISHFESRWDIHENMYHSAIENQKKYLLNILNIPESDPRDHLKRNGIVDKIREKENNRKKY